MFTEELHVLHGGSNLLKKWILEIVIRLEGGENNADCSDKTVLRIKIVRTPDWTKTNHVNLEQN